MLRNKNLKNIDDPEYVVIVILKMLKVDKLGFVALTCHPTLSLHPSKPGLI